MFDRIDVYIKARGRWIYHESTRMHRTMAACKRHYLSMHGLTVQCRRD